MCFEGGEGTENTCWATSSKIIAKETSLNKDYLFHNYIFSHIKINIFQMSVKAQLGTDDMEKGTSANICAILSMSHCGQ